METKEILNISGDNKLCDKLILDERGITYQCLSEYKLKMNTDRVAHCYCPYGSIKKVDLDKNVYYGINVVFIANNEEKKFGFMLCDPAKNRELKDAIRFIKSHMKKAKFEEGIIYNEKKEEKLFENETEHIMHCEACGHVYHYNDDDIKKNQQKIKDSGTSIISAVAAGMAGNYMVSTMNSQSAKNELNSIVDYLSCPKCHSRKTKRITEKEFEELKAKSNQSVAPVSNLDEIKKLKELLDLGAITEEEFNAKKKELLGL